MRPQVPGRRAPQARWLAMLGAACLLGGCGEGLPEIELTLSKNCNEAEVRTLVPAVPLSEANETLVDIAADGVDGDTAWILVRRPTEDGSEVELVVQQIDAHGIRFEQEVLSEDVLAPGYSLRPAPQAGRVWVVRDEPGVYQVWRIAPDDPARPVLPSENLASFPPEVDLCLPCDVTAWPRELIFLDGQPAVLSLPPFSTDAGLIVWIAAVDTSSVTMRLRTGHRLNFEPPCEDSSPAGMAACEEDHMTLHYPAITILGVQQDPRLTETAVFGHRTRVRTYDGDVVGPESADVFMISSFLDSRGDPAGVLRSYAGLFVPTQGPIEDIPLHPTADPPHGIAVDRFAAYGLFSHGGDAVRLVQLPDIDPDFIELTDRVQLDGDMRLLQLDRDLGFGRIAAGAWEVTKLFPDRPSQSITLTHETNAPITQVRSGGIGTFMLEKGAAAPEVVRLQCSGVDLDDGEL